MNAQQHDKWLRKIGAHPDQIKSRKKPTKKAVGFSVAKNYYNGLSNGIAPPVLNNSIWEKIRIGQESPLTIAAIREKASRVGPSFNKGGLQLLNGSEEIKAAGKKYVL